MISQLDDHILAFPQDSHLFSTEGRFFSALNDLAKSTLHFQTPRPSAAFDTAN